jgi:uncharacterized protein (TIGR02453 family)
MSFECFPKETFQFLSDLELNNNRTWFQENKSRYENDLLDPMLHYIAEYSRELKYFAPQFTADPRKLGSIFRIYRDVRFSRDKRPYKTYTGCRFWNATQKSVHAPCFYTQLETSKVLVGAGTWMPAKEDLAAIRARIESKPELWQDVKDSLFKSGYLDVRGERLKRVPRGFSALSIHSEDLKLKSFFVINECSVKQATQKDWMAHTRERFEAALPLLEFVCRAMGRKI